VDPLYPTDPDRGDSQAVLLCLRELFSRCPRALSEGPETLAQLLWEGRYLTRWPSVFEVEAALDALTADGEVQP
jgi:hypothetical protein